jgi:hypothetical protein
MNSSKSTTGYFNRVMLRRLNSNRNMSGKEAAYKDPNRRSSAGSECEIQVVLSSGHAVDPFQEHSVSSLTSGHVVIQQTL